MLTTIALVFAAITVSIYGFNPETDLKNDFRLVAKKGHRLAGILMLGNKNKCDLTRPKIRKFGYCFNDTENEQRGINTDKERGWVREVVQQWEKCGGIKIVEEKACRKGPDFIRINVGNYHPVVFPEVDTATCTIEGFEMYFGFYTYGDHIEGYRKNPKILKSTIQMYALHEFGHFLGFDHEHNRKDRHGECSTPVDKPSSGPDARYGTSIITQQYDTDSIMNYCTKNVHFKPWLSKLDKEGVKAKYGGGNQQECDAVTKPWTWTKEELGDYAGILDELNGVSTGSNNNNNGGGITPPPPGVCVDVEPEEVCAKLARSCGDESMKHWCRKTCKYC